VSRSSKIMLEPDQQRTVAYIVKAWPRLSETFILNEIISLEERGVPIRIFSVKDPDPGPAHSKVAQVRAKITYLALQSHWKQAVAANLRLLCRRPGRYLWVFAHVVAAKLVRRSFGLPRHFFQAGYLADILSREPADHLHAHFASTPARVARLTHRLSGIPYTFTAHAKDIYLSDPKAFRGKLMESRAVVTCTEYNRSYLLKQFGSLAGHKIHRIYHGLDTSQFGFHPRQTIENGEPIILSVARLVEKKGLEDLIAAADILRRRGRVFRVEIIGSGPQREALRAQAKEMGLADRVRLAGAQTHDAVCLAYQRASIFVLPCVVASNGDRDGIPNVLLEAMASGVPVISTPVSGIPEIIDPGVNGLLVPPHDPESLADAIDGLLASPELCERLARAARTKLEASFSLEASARQLLAIFRGQELGKQSPIDLPSAVAAEGAVALPEGS
jgi:glycosyltransferase involved in cell wall biosynthesis